MDICDGERMRNATIAASIAIALVVGLVIGAFAGGMLEGEGEEGLPTSHITRSSIQQILPML
jgi:hypothetical protein